MSMEDEGPMDNDGVGDESDADNFLDFICGEPLDVGEPDASFEAARPNARLGVTFASGVVLMFPAALESKDTAVDEDSTPVEES
jgi:hypothetical protein